MKNGKLIRTLVLEDHQQDFLEIDLYKNGVILGYSPLFSNGRISMIGIGAKDGIDYETLKSFIENGITSKEKIYIYFKKTGEDTPLPWEAGYIKYPVIKIKIIN